MPAKPGKREQDLIKLFVSAYEDFAWAESKIDPLDEHLDGAIKALITRADGQTMAIEHTLIEPFVGDKRDFAMFEQALLGIEGDKSLAVPGAGITVFVPVGILDGQTPLERNGIVQSIHSWITNNRLSLREGKQRYQCHMPGVLPITLTVQRTRLGSGPGRVWVRRQQVANDLDKVIEKALRKKLPKLSNTNADRRLLFLERDQMPLDPDLIFTEIERQRPNFRLLEKVDEIWHVETIFYHEGYVDFELWKGGRVLTTMTFGDGALVGRSKDGVPCSTKARVWTER